MAYREFHYCWEETLQSSPAALWPYVADTNRFNHDTKLPAVAEKTPAGKEALTNARRLLRFRLPFVAVAWEEEPFEWVYPYRYGVVRRYRKGPLDSMRVLLEMMALPGGGTRLVYQVWVRPRNLIGFLGIPVAIGLVSAYRFRTAFVHYDQLAQQEELPMAYHDAIRLSSGGRRRLEAIQATLRGQGVRSGLMDRLVDLITHADEITLSRIRPYVLADHWDVPREDVLELFLLATRAGLLNFQWELLCPLCRGAEDKVYEHLADIQSTVHCHTCNIDYEVNFEHSVELTFTPNPAVRQVDASDFCVAGPQMTPHIVVQQLLDPGERRTVAPILETGRYRLRALNMSGGWPVRVTAVGQPEATFSASQVTEMGGELELSTTPTLLLENDTDGEQLLILERTAWSDQATTAAEVTTLQRFRDLFADEALRPGEQISVGRLTILFTDLCESTQMYQEIGDAPAFGVVMNHFDVLREMIEAEGGAMIKTIGDAVMAVFRRPLSGLRAITRAQQVLADPPGGQRPLILRAGLHQGSSIAVTLNNQLDYFGSTVNAAARLEKLSRGGDVIISEAVWSDPEVNEFLQGRDAAFAAQQFENRLKGFDEECFALWRIYPAAETAVALDEPVTA